MLDAKRFHIVIAEDNHADVTLVQEALKLHGVSCEIAVIGDGAEAIRYFLTLDLDSRAPVPDLVLLDMHLPKYDGNDILKALRSSERAAQTPVIVITSSSTAEVEQLAQQRGALHYFKKPCDWEEFAKLGAIVQNLLEKRNPHQSEAAPETAGGHG